MSIKLQMPKVIELKPRITVIGVGGAGGNAVNNMIASGLDGVEFIVANTDAQALAISSAENRIQLGINLTEGLGAGSKPEIGQAAAEEALDDLKSQVAGSHMVFIAAGMGGGTGTGAAAVIARAAKEQGVLVVAIVTKPFQFEGARRMRVAEAGIAELEKNVDTLIVIPNQNLFRVANERTTFAEAFVLADQVLYSGIACIVDLIVKEGLINLDFADVRTVLCGMGTAMMGTGEASGDRRAILAAEEAIANPLLDDVSLRGARGLLLSIIGGHDLTLYEVDEAASRVRQEVDPEANIIVGATFDDSLKDRVRVSIVASGMSLASRQTQPPAAAPIAVKPPAPSPLAAIAPVPAPAPMQPAPSQPIAAPKAQRPEPVRAPQVQPQPQVQAHAAEPTQQDADEMSRVLTAAYQSDAPPHPAPTSVPGRPVWESPDGVTIEEGLGAFTAGHTPPPLPQQRPEPVAKHQPAPQFRPQAPTEIKRSPARVPGLEEFPEVGQRDYRAKAGPATTAPPQQQVGSPRIYGEAPAPQPKRKPGLFERIAGIGRRDEHPAQMNDDYAQAGRGDPRGAPRPSEQPQRRAVGDGRRPLDKNDHEAADLPDFFDDRRR